MDGKFKKGHTMSEETKRKISEKLKGRKKSPGTILRMSVAQKKVIKSEEQLKRIKTINIGRKASKETKLKKSLAQRGAKGSNWKGGITPLVMEIRHCFKMRQWISDIFYRDDFTCQACNKRGKKLNAHHIKSFSKIFKDNNIKNLEEALDCDEMWNLNNGQTLCVECHKKISTRRDV